MLFLSLTRGSKYLCRSCRSCFKLEVKEICIDLTPLVKTYLFLVYIINPMSIYPSIFFNEKENFIYKKPNDTYKSKKIYLIYI